MSGSAEQGPPAWENWQAFDELDAPVDHTLEYVLYSDSRWVGEITEGIGPYELLNTIGGPARPEIGVAQPVLALRSAQAIEPPTIPKDAAKHLRGTFHGGWIDEEIAALVSVIFECRCRSGGMWRVFDRGQDERGKPYTFQQRAPLLGRVEDGHPQLPHLPREVRFDDATEWLNQYRALSAKQALVLVRAARAFQLGMWSADDDPDLAWLRLISALEAAAKYWLKKDDQTDMAVLEQAWPELADVLTTVEIDIRDQITRLVAPQARVKSAVMRFVDEFGPGPPPARPEMQHEQLDWDKLPAYIASIYNRRSEMLHSAIPLPKSMTSPLFRQGGKAPPPEASFSMGWHDSNWPHQVAPMPLWTFSYIVAGSLKKWWHSLGKPDEATGRPAADPDMD